MDVTKKLIKLIALLLALILIIYFIRALLTFSIFPIYPDEVGFKLWFTRFWQDFPSKTNILPLCQSYIQPLSWCWYLPSLLLWLSHGLVESLTTYRQVGILFHLLLILLLTSKLYFSIPKKILLSSRIIPFILLLALVIALLELGVNGFFLSTNRQEQILLTFSTLLLFLFYLPDYQSNTKLKSFFIIALYFFCTMMILYAHPKSLLLTPVFIIIAVRLAGIFNKKKWAMSIIFLILLIQLSGNYFAWSKAIDCSNLPKLNAMLMSFNLNPKNIIYKPFEFFVQLRSNIFTFNREIAQISFKEYTDINYLPPLKLSLSLKLVNYLILLTYGFVLIITPLMLLIKYRKDWQAGHYLSSRLLLLTLYSCILLNPMMNSTKCWYDASYLWTLIVINFIFTLSDYLPALINKKNSYLSLIYFLIVGLFSLHCLIRSFELPFLNGYSGPSIALIDFNQLKISAELKKIEQVCGIRISQSKGVILDNLTYFYFQKSKNPMLITYFFYPHTTTDNFSEFVSRYPVEGFIVRRWGLPQKLESKYTVQIGRFICIPSAKVKAFIKELKQQV